MSSLVRPPVPLVRPLMRTATLDGYAQLARSLGLDPASTAATVGLDLADLERPERWIPAATGALLLDTSASRSCCEDFAIRLADFRRLSTLGPISVALREEPDLRRLLWLLIRHEQSVNEALRMRLEEAEGIATLRLSLNVGGSAPLTQALVLAVAALTVMVRECIGDHWQPLAASFTFQAPTNPEPFHRMFGPGLRFADHFNGLVLSDEDLSTPNMLSDPLLRPYAQQFLEVSLSPRESTVTADVRETAELLLPLGKCSMTRVARALDLDSRTLRRRLAREGSSFSQIVNEARVRQAHRHLLARQLSMTDISQLLGFEAPSTFSRWFRQEFGMSPREWQTSAGAG